MPDPAAVKRALARLASDSVGAGATARSDDEDPRTELEDLVAAAATASESLEDAAAFAEAGRADQLRAVVRDPPPGADAATLARGRTLLSDLERLRAALDGAGSADRREGEATTDQFHSGRTTLLGGGGVASDR